MGGSELVRGTTERCTERKRGKEREREGGGGKSSGIGTRQTDR